MSTAKWSTALVAVLLVGVGVGVGSAGAGEPETVTKTVTKEVPGPVETKTETKEVEVEVVPAECVAALDTAEKSLRLAGEGLSLGSEYIALLPRTLDAGMNYDMAAVEQIAAESAVKTSRMKVLVRQTKTLAERYTIDSAICREVAGR